MRVITSRKAPTSWMPAFLPRSSAAEVIVFGVTIDTVSRLAYVPMIAKLPPATEALTTGSILAPPIATSSATTACTTFTPESKFWMLTSRACCLNRPSSWATTTSMLAKLVLPVGSPIRIVAGVSVDAGEAASPVGMNTTRPARGALPQITASIVSTTPTPTARTCCMRLLLGIGLTPRRDARFDHFQQSGGNDAKRHEHNYGHKHARRLKGMGIGDNEVSQPGNGSVEFGDDDGDQCTADRQADASHDERQCRR